MELNAAGFLLDKELEYLQGAVEKPKRPLMAIVGGAKVSTKIPVIESLLDKCDVILIGGGMIFTFYKAMGYNIGASLVEDDIVDLAKSLMEKAKAKGVKMILPTDVILADAFDNDANTAIAKVTEISGEWRGLDIGPDSIAAFKEEIEAANTIVWWVAIEVRSHRSCWFRLIQSFTLSNFSHLVYENRNGPMGVFEMSNFAEGTNAIANMLAEATATRGAITIVGGGDSVAAINKAGLGDKVSHISTGGGASLELLEGKTLPGVAALTEI